MTDAKKDLERIIREGMEDRITHATINGEEHIVITEAYARRIERTAQAIIDRLEIDEEKTEKILRKTKLTIKTTRKKCPLCGSRGDITYWEGGIATAITKAKPIRLKEGDK